MSSIITGIGVYLIILAILFVALIIAVIIALIRTPQYTQEIKITMSQEKKACEDTQRIEPTLKE